MKHKTVVSTQIDSALAVARQLIAALEDDKPYATKEYWMDQVKQIDRSLDKAQQYIQLEDE